LDGFRGAPWLPSYLRRDATALGLLLLSMLDITSSFHRMAVQFVCPRAMPEVCHTSNRMSIGEKQL
jgi:hypothetical protein